MNSNAFYQDSSPNKDSFSSSVSSQNFHQPQNETIQMRFNKILIQADQLMAKEEYADAVTKLNLLTQKINVFIITFYRSQFLKLNQKPYDKKMELVCLYNLASAYHKQWILDQCIPLVDKFLIMLKSAIQQQQAKGKSNYWYKMKHLLIKTQLQYCAILSQVGDHFKALKIAIQVSESLKEFFQKGFNEVNKFLSKIHKIESKKSLASSWGSDTGFTHQIISNDKVQFATSLLTQAKQNLSELLKIQTHDQIIKQNFDKVRQQLVQLKSRTYFWKDNPQNNIKLLRKQLSQQNSKQSGLINSGKQGEGQQRSLLGIKKSKSWIEQITIAKIMVMSPINYLQFTEKDNIIFQFNYKNIVQKIILVSVTYFSLAIELRFIETAQKSEKEKKQSSQPLGKQKKIISKQPQQKSQEMKKSEVFHLKSIVLLCKLIKENSSFLNHLVMNYHKHYKQDLITIQEESSMAEFSHIYEKKNKNPSTNRKLSQNQFILPEDSDEQDEILTPSPIYPKQSAYFQDHEVQQIIKRKSPVSKKSPLNVLRKSNKKDCDLSQEKSKKYQQSISTSRNQARDVKSARYSKHMSHKQVNQDRTMKKISSSKMITITSPQKFRLFTEREKDKSSEKESSLSKFHSMRSFEKKQFSTRTLQSLSLGKTSMNSTTLKNKKRRGQKSPEKEKLKLNDLKESQEFKKADFKKKEKQLQRQKQKIPIKIKDKKKEKLNNGLTLLKQSSSNPNLRTGIKVKSYNFDEQYASIKQKSKKVDANFTKR